MSTEAETIAELQSENAELKGQIQKALARISKLEKDAKAKTSPAKVPGEAAAVNGEKPPEKKSNGKQFFLIVAGVVLLWCLGWWAYNTYTAIHPIHGWWVSKAKEPWASPITGWLEPQKIHFMQKGKFEFYSDDGHDMRDISSATWQLDENTVEITPTGTRGKNAKFTFFISDDTLTLTNTADKKETMFIRASRGSTW